MEPPTLGSLVADFYIAEENRNGACREKRIISDLITKMSERIDESTTEINDLQAAHDQMQRHANSSFRSGRIKKARKKVARRNACRKEIADVRSAKSRMMKQLSRLKEQYRRVHGDVGMRALQACYCLARHHMMAKISMLEEADAEARERKLGYMHDAGIPEGVLPEDVYYYIDVDIDDWVQVVHLFYGGKKSPTGEGVSPDGAGHGHYILSISFDGNNRQVQYTRAPGKARA